MRIVQALWLGVTVGFLFGCGSGSSSGSSSAPPPPPVQTAAELSALSPTTISATVTTGETESLSATFSNSGDAALTYELTTTNSFISIVNGSGSVAIGASTTVGIDVTCNGPDENGSLRLVTNDANAAQTDIPVSVTCEPLPSFNISRVVMNQGARVFDTEADPSPAFGVIEGRDLLVRAFVTGTGIAPDADVVVLNSGGGTQRFAMQTPATVSQTPADESILIASHYSVVPASALSVGASVRVEVSPQGNTTVYPETGNIDLGVVDPGVFNVTFVPVTFNGQTPIINGEQYLRQTRQMLPVGDYDIDIRVPYVFTGPYDLDTLLDEITDLRNLDGSNRLYHAVIIPENQGSQTAGLGYVGFPVSLSIDLGGTQNIISHEIGHNLNLRHAPGCDAPNSDPDYPYADADISSWGYDIISQQLVEPTASKKDLMSYCSDLWISDYHFDRALVHRAANPLGVNGQPGLLVSGRIVAGQVEGLKLLPAPSDAVSVAQEGPYTVVAYDASGQMIGSSAMTGYEIGDGDAGVIAFSVALEGTMAELHHLAIYQPDGVMLSHQVDTNYAAVAQTSWQGGRRFVNWQRQGEETLIIRDADGQVRSVDRTGRVDVSEFPARVQLELVRPGSAPRISWLGPDDNQRIQWAQ